MNVTVAGKEYPMVYSVFAQRAIEKKYGSLEQMQAKLAENNDSGTLPTFIFLASVMMKAAEQRERARCQIYGEEFKGETALTAEQLEELVDISEFEGLIKAVAGTMNGGKKRDVELVDETKKEKATPS